MKNWKRHASEYGPYLLLIAAVFLVYANVYENGFLFDDEFLLQKNRFITSWSYLGKIFSSSSTAGFGGTDSFYRPLQTLAYLLVYQIFGLSTLGFHLLNVSIHAANAVLVFVLGQRLKFARGAALAAALLWAVHPLHVEAVTYQSATADVLYVFWILFACVCLLPEVSLRKIFGVLPLFAAGLLSKESAIVFPVLAMTLIYVRSEAPWKPASYLKTWPLWTMALAYLALRKTWMNFDDSFHFYKTSNIYTEHILYRTETFLAAIPSYLELLVIPHDLHMERSFPVYTTFMAPAVQIGALTLLLIGAQWLWGRGRYGKEISFATLWFLAAQIPQTGILIPMNSLFLEHWMYLPSVGLFLGLAGGFGARPRGRFSQGGFVAFIFSATALFGYKTYMQNETWSDPVTFYNHILKYETGSQRVHNNLAMAYSDGGFYSKAMEHYEKSISMGDTYPQTQNNLGLLLVNIGHIEEGIRHLKRATEIDPRFYQAYANLAEVYSKTKRPREAEEYYKKYEETKKLFGL